jgi:hypothetical protein
MPAICRHSLGIHPEILLSLLSVSVTNDEARPGPGLSTNPIAGCNSTFTRDIEDGNVRALSGAVKRPKRFP